MPVKSIGVTLKTPFLDIGGTWEPNDAERRAAWELYVELITRVAVVPLPADQGLLREALTSMYQLFGIHREVLRRYGPSVAEPKKDGQYNLGYLAVATLNYAVRPFLAQWHPTLSDWEARRPADVPAGAYERGWDQQALLRADLDRVRGYLRTYAHWLSEACEVPDLLAAVPDAGYQRLDQ